MTDISSSLRTFLLTDTSIEGLVGTRVYPDMLPQKSSDVNVLDRPAIWYRTISDYDSVSTGGRLELVRMRIEINCVAETRKDANDLAKYVRTKLSGYQGTMGSHRCQGAFMENGYTSYDPTTKEYTVSRDFQIWAEE